MNLLNVAHMALAYRQAGVDFSVDDAGNLHSMIPSNVDQIEVGLFSRKYAGALKLAVLMDYRPELLRPFEALREYKRRGTAKP